MYGSWGSHVRAARQPVGADRARDESLHRHDDARDAGQRWRRERSRATARRAAAASRVPAAATSTPAATATSTARGDDGSWQKYDGGSWGSGEKPTPRDGSTTAGTNAGTTNRAGTNDTYGQLERDRAARTEGTTRTRDYGTMRARLTGGGSYRGGGATAAAAAADVPGSGARRCADRRRGGGYGPLFGRTDKEDMMHKQMIVLVAAWADVDRQPRRAVEDGYGQGGEHHRDDRRNRAGHPPAVLSRRLTAPTTSSTCPRPSSVSAASRSARSINVTHYENVVLRMEAPGAAPIDSSSRAVTPATGTAGTAARQQTITATISAIDPKLPSVSFTGPRGWNYTTRVQDKELLGSSRWATRSTSPGPKPCWCRWRTRSRRVAGGGERLVMASPSSPPTPRWRTIFRVT